jgi:hypothetical protein
MTLIKIVLILAFISVLIWAFRNRTHVGLRAGTRLGIFAITALAVASILRPGITQVIADFLGVTRGTDLVLYAVTVAFFVSSLATYFRFREQDRRLVEIVRENAIREALLAQAVHCNHQPTPTYLAS